MNVTRCISAIVILIALLAFTATFALAGVPVVLTEAQTMYNEGRFAEAIDHLTKLASDSALNPTEAKEVYLLLAKAAAGKNFTDQAIVYMKKVVELEPGFRLNTAIEPPQVQRIWFRVDSLRATEDAASKMRTLAILYFENNSVTDHEAMDGLSKGISAMLVTDLMGTPGLRIVERERVQFLMDELKMQKSEYYDQTSGVKVGRLLGAHNLLLGSFSKIDNKKIRIDARLVKTETGEVIKSDKIEGNSDDLARLQNDLAAKVASWMGVELAANPQEDEQPIGAVLAYTRGLNLEDEMQLSAAYEAYKQALAVDPDFEGARNRLVALEPIISASGG